MLSSLSKWAPIRLDALGIVTLIDEQAVNRCIGRLVRYRYVEYLPLLAGQVVGRERHGTANTRLSLVQHHRQNSCNGYCGLVLILALGAGVHVEFHNNTRRKQHSRDSIAGRKVR